MIDYFNEIKFEGEGCDQIKICEDIDGDGCVDKFMIFVKNLSIFMSFVFVNGGVIVY